MVLTAGVASFLLFAQGVWLDVAAPILGIQLQPPVGLIRRAAAFPTAEKRSTAMRMV